MKRFVGRNHRGRKQDRGSVLVMGLILIVVVTAVVASSVGFIQTEMRIGEHSRAWMQALLSAESGVEVAMQEFNRDLVSSAGTWVSWSSPGGNTRSLASTALPTRPSARHPSTYSVLANRSTLIITSTGTVDIPRLSDTITRTVQVGLELNRPSGWLDFGMLAKEYLKIQGTPYCDAYDARLGTYASQPPLAECDVGSMGYSTDAFTGGGAAWVAGDAAIRSTATAPSSFWSGSLTVDPEWPESIGYVAPPQTHMTHAALAGSTTINISGNTYIGTPSVSCNSLTITGYGELSMYVQGAFGINTPQSLTLSPTAGKTIVMKIFLNGDANIKGDLNTGGDPFNLQLYGTANCLTIDCQANNPKALVIMAPNAKVNLLGTSAIMGAVFGREIHAGGTFDFHYDVSLKDRIGSSRATRYKVISWMEL